MKILYPLFIHLLVFGFKLGARFNRKLKLGLEGRKASLEIVRSRFKKTDQVLWMHAASLGEYEQGLPVLEELEQAYPECKTLITFFSPSGYEHVAKRHFNSERVFCYLPFDLSKNIIPFVSSFKTKLFFTVKYDYWYQLISELRRGQAQLYVISALFYKEQLFFKPLGRSLVSKLRDGIDWFFHQTSESFHLASGIGLTNGSVSGDTRFDRVRENVNRAKSIPYMNEFKNQGLTLVFGSSWEKEEILARKIHQKHPSLKLVLAPHDLNRIEKLAGLFPDAVFYSKLNPQNALDLKNCSVLIIDSIGMLSNLYQYGDLAVIGGGFHDKGLHNCLEAAAFGIPVFFGNHYKGNPEADALVAMQAGCSFSTVSQAEHYLDELLSDPDKIKCMGAKAKQLVESQPYSSKLILDKIQRISSERIL